MSERPIWSGPLLTLAGLTAIAGAAACIAIWRGALPDPWGAGLAWGLAGTSLTLTIARIWHVREVARRELELLLVAGGILLVQYFVLAPLR